ncbi:protein of unknown function [Pseudomonas inefficax]|uniref:Uncharacterized protein n=1 Tax=Pseudomonas inefficax TaxID=2078786 RepID=A0AAQ1P698_9PSED|nr:protein of unknown function [Pseudomonas inefficax]
MTGGKVELDTAALRAYSRVNPLPQVLHQPLQWCNTREWPRHRNPAHPRRPSCPARVAPCFSITSPWTWAISTSRP